MALKNSKNQKAVLNKNSKASTDECLPPPGAPRCLHCTIEVVIDNSNDNSSSHDSSSTNPYFRYCFPGGECVNSDPLNYSKLSGWAVHNLAPSPNQHSTQRWLWSRRHQLQGNDDKDAAIKLNEDSYVTFFLGDDTKKYLNAWIMDLSCFLSADSEIREKGSSLTIFEMHDGRVRNLPLGVRRVEFKFQLDNPGVDLFDPIVIQILNPMTLSLNSISNLPSHAPVAYELFQPVFVTCCPFPSYVTSRIMVANLITNSSTDNVNLSHTSVFLTGEDVVSHEILREWFECDKINIEVHDRNLLFPSISDEAARLSSSGIDPQHIDKEISKELQSRFCLAGDTFAHGYCSFSLCKFQMMDPNIFKIDIDLDICPSKPRCPPNFKIESIHTEKLPLHPVQYIENSCSLSMSISLARPISPTEDCRLFSRAIFITEYCNTLTLENVTCSIEAINNSSLKVKLNKAGDTIRTYQFTLEDIKEINAGNLDVISGVTCIDEHCRMIIVEGLASKGMRTLLNNYTREAKNSCSYKVLADSSVKFRERLYTTFHADLKKIRLIFPLPIICQNPEVYNRERVSLDCFNCLNKLRQLRAVDSLKQAKSFSLFPSCTQLLEVELRYGTSVSKMDRFGTPNKLLPSINLPIDATLQEKEFSKIEEFNKLDKHHIDTRNTQFENFLRERTQRNFISEQKSALKLAKDAYEIRREKRMAEIDSETIPTDWCYSTQKLNYTERKKAEMKEKYLKQRSSTFTYSSNFISLSVCLVDSDKVERDEKERNRKAWITPEGFVYPAPKSQLEFNRHPKRPSDSRIAILHEPWIENECTANIVDSSLDRSDKPLFECMPSNGKMIFGGLTKPVFSRPYDGAVMDKIWGKLPRGPIVEGSNCPDNSFFTSIHIANFNVDEQEQTKNAIHKEKEVMMDKVLVDDVHFHVGGFNVNDKLCQIDRTKDILHGRAIKKSCKMVRNINLPSGKIIPFPNPPISALAFEPYIDGSIREKLILRNNKFISKYNDKVTDFVKYVHSDRMKPKSQTFTSNRHVIKPVSTKEMVGARWKSALTNDQNQN